MDLDGEGPIELVVAHEGGTITVLRDLVAGAPVFIGSDVYDIAAADWDANGAQDLVLAVPGRHALQVMLGDGRGGLGSGPLYLTGAAPFAVVTGDLDDDGALDLASANALDDTVSVIFGDGAGGVREQTSYPTGPEPRALLLAAEGTNQRTLYVVAHASSTVQRVDLQGGVSLVGGPPPRVTALAAGDLDGDSRDEIFYGANASAEIGTLQPAEGLSLTTRWQASGVQLAIPLDIDDDGVDEIAIVPTDTSQETDTGIVTLLSSDGERLSELPANMISGGIRGALAGDMNGDGLSDVVAWNSAEIFVFAQSVDSSFSLDVSYALGGFIGSSEKFVGS